MVDIHYVGHIDRDPDATRRAVLAVLVGSPVGLRRRAVQQVVYGTDRYGAHQTIDALRSLEDRKLVERAYDPWSGAGSRKWRATAAGRAALDLDAAMGEAS